MTPGKEGPGKGKNIMVLADFFFSEWTGVSKLSSNFYRGLRSSSVLWFYSGIILIGCKYYIYKPINYLQELTESKS